MKRRNPMHRHASWLLACLLAILYAPSDSARIGDTGSAIDSILFVLSADKPIYHQLVNSARRHLEARRGKPFDTKTLLLDEIQPTHFPPGGVQLIVAVGTRAANALIDRPLRVPVVEVLIPEPTARKLHARGRGNGPRIALALEQPLPRQLELIHQLLPSARDIGVLLGPSSQGDRPAIETAIRAAGFRPTVAEIRDTDDLGPALDRLLHRSDVILAVPDKLIFNRATVYRLLLASYRQGVPVIGFSRALVRSGALAAVHSTAEDLGAALADLIAENLPNEEAGERTIVHSRHYHVSINRAVARSLGLQPPDIGVLTKALRDRDP